LQELKLLLICMGGDIAMPVLATGEDRVRRLQQALGGSPPAGVGERPAASIKQFLAEHRGRQRALRDEQVAIQRDAAELLLGQLKDDPRLASLSERAKSLAERRQRQKHAFRPIARSAESAVIFGSDIWIKTPPYDELFTDGRDVTVQADAAGNYVIQAQSLGDGYYEGSAGFGTVYYSPYVDTNKRFSVLLQYDDNWWDSAMAVTAQNFLVTRLWIWGAREGFWVQQVDTGPSQNDSVGWFDSHGGDPFGTVALETHFVAQADSWYTGFIWSEASVNSGSLGPFGFSDSSIDFHASVPFVVFATDSG
jgi:hypothetical protein